MLKQNILHFLKLHPSSLILIALLIPIIPLEIYNSSWLSVNILLIIIFIFLLFLSSKIACKVLFWGIIGCIIFQINTYFFNSNWSSQFRNRTLRVDIKATITDPTAVGESLHWLKNSKYL
ncbi:MAG: hypothetical protein GY756_20215, partial [bacterium]|nr:hypothetical protein [bacterium]